MDWNFGTVFIMVSLVLHHKTWSSHYWPAYT